MLFTSLRLLRGDLSEKILLQEVPSPRLCAYTQQRSSGNNVLTQCDILQNTVSRYVNRYAWKKDLWSKKFSEF